MFHKVSSTINAQKIAFLESTSKNVDEESFAHENVDVVEQNEIEVVETSSQKRKCIDEIVSVFIEKLSKENIYDILYYQLKKEEMQ